MGAVDRTLLANLGFSDPDKKDPLHDLGCQYIALPHVCNEIGLKYGDQPLVFNTGRQAMFEYPVSKGSNQYKTTIGFLDVVLPLCVESVDVTAVGIVEVKTTPIGLGNVLRQINLYREYINNGEKWILAVTFEMSTQFAEGLRSHDIFPVQLGEGFRKWVAEQRAAPRATNVPSL